ncbi:hypothetical protein FNF27_04398 [Cafeteria roenbergensis]|uniref:Uncharacterized protein n=1 Tax=Cafeteria roenbergensis TaxID=33653 RepID=A0A5A8EBR2_CAFRO|nr:hypothetical protein FNF27_04398 [Cafeteria roenbergensis]
MPSPTLVATVAALAVGAASARSPIRGAVTRQDEGRVLSKREGFVELAATHAGQARDASSWANCVEGLRPHKGTFQSKHKGNVQSFVSSSYGVLSDAGCDMDDTDILYSCVRLAFEATGDVNTCEEAIAEEENAPKQDFSGLACTPGAKSATFDSNDPATWDAQPLQVCSEFLNNFGDSEGKRLLRDLAGCHLNGNSKTRTKLSPRTNVAMHQHAASGSHGIGFVYERQSGTSKVTPKVVDYATGRAGNEYKWTHSGTGYNPDFPSKCSSYDQVVPN